jgi:hypothetical protein
VITGSRCATTVTAGVTCAGAALFVCAWAVVATSALKMPTSATGLIPGFIDKSPYGRDLAGVLHFIPSDYAEPRLGFDARGFT